MDKFKNLVEKARSCRRYVEGYTVPYDVLEELVDIARLAPSARNGQVIRYALINDKKTCDEFKPLYALAAALKGDDRPQKGQEPNAYIVLLAPENLSEWAIMDLGIVGQILQLAATEKGLGACMIGAYNKEKVLDLLKEKGLTSLDPIAQKQAEPEEIPLQVRLILALGKSDEERALEDVDASKATGYYRKDNVHHVPKRSLKDLILLKA